MSGNRVPGWNTLREPGISPVAMAVIGLDWTFIWRPPACSEDPDCQRRCADKVRVPSLRRHDPDQVRRVTASAASQPLARDTPENGPNLRPWTRGSMEKAADSALAALPVVCPLDPRD